MSVSKEEERKALDKIKKIVDELGENSYIGAAFDGCFEIAEDNIGNDFCCSMKQRTEAAEKRESESQRKIALLEDKLKKLEKDSKADLELAHLVAEKKEKEIASLRERVIPDRDIEKISTLISVVNQLLLLLRICAAPQTLNEYKGDLPEKFKTILSLLRRHESERIAIGVRHINVANAYADAVHAAFPDRPVFLITGKEATLRKRKEIVKKLKNTENGILISTQQSLSASMNIDFVNVCIIPELHWNNASMSQYYFRFIRYTSTEHKRVYFVTYEQSIESNLLKMVLVKDKLNLFMKDQEVTDEELYERFGIDAAMLENLMYKEKTEDGTVIRWGNQKIS